MMILYIAVISVIAVILTVYDKAVSVDKRKRRVPEKVLMTVGALGGATAMYLTMQAIRHKTKHIKFMAGLPVCIAVHLILILLVFFK